MIVDTVVPKSTQFGQPKLDQLLVSEEAGVCCIRSKTGHMFLVDSADLDAVMQLDWYGRQRPNTVRFTAHLPSKKGSVQLGRFIARTPAGKYADHINGDASDNRRSNLRNCEPRQNSANSHLRFGKSCPFKGVTQHRPGRYRATARSEGKLVHLGTAPDAETAARLYDAFARKSFGSFARLNFPLAGEQSAFREVPNAS